MIILEGLLKDDGDEDLSIKSLSKRVSCWSENLASKIAFMLTEKYIVNKSDYNNKYEITDDYDFNWIDSDVSLDNVIFRYQIFDDAKELMVEDTLKGKINIYTELSGYSEYTITGTTTELFKIGNIDLNKLLKRYDGLYIKIEIKVSE